MAAVSAVDAVARMLAGSDPSPRWWRRAHEVAVEVVTEMNARPVEVVRGPVPEVRATRRACVGCSGAIEPGQAYVVTGGPRHFGCGERP
jgi:hypothetical protein